MQKWTVKLCLETCIRKTSHSDSFLLDTGRCQIYRIKIQMPILCMGYKYTKKNIVYLKSKFNGDFVFNLANLNLGKKKFFKHLFG